MHPSQHFVLRLEKLDFAVKSSTLKIFRSGPLDSPKELWEEWDNLKLEPKQPNCQEGELLERKKILCC